MQSLLNFERIEGQVDREIAAALDNPAPPRGYQPRVKVVAGIDVIDQAAHQNAASAYIDGLKTYQRDADALKSKLDAAGVSRLAILPTQTWDTMCKEAGLYRFTPDAKGEVGASTAGISDLEASIRSRLGIMPMAAMAAGAIFAAAATLYLMSGWAWGWQAVGAVIAAVVGGQALGMIVESMFFVDKQVKPAKLAELEGKQVRKRFATQASTLAMLWPNRTEEKGDFRIKIRVPPAPADAQANLERAHAAKLQLSLAIVGEAIGFAADPAALLLKRRGEQYEQMAAEIERRRLAREAERAARAEAARLERLYDPIVTTSLGSATAVIVQYGEFPIEQAVVDRVLKEQLA